MKSNLSRQEFSYRHFSSQWLYWVMKQKTHLIGDTNYEHQNLKFHIAGLTRLVEVKSYKYISNIHAHHVLKQSPFQNEVSEENMNSVHVVMTGTMENRHVPGHSPIYGTDNEHIWNNHPSDPQPHSANGSFMLPADLAVHGLNTVTYHNSGPGTDVFPVPNQRLDVRSLMNNTGTSYDPCIYPNNGMCSQFPSHHAQHDPCHNHVGVRDAGAANNCQMNYDRAAYKRKSSAISDVERGKTNVYHSIGSSSNHFSSAERLQAENILGPQYCPSGLLDAGPSYRSNNMPVPDEAFQRNVRNRHGNALHLGISSASHSSSNTSLDLPSEHNSGHIAAEQWNHTSSLASHTTSSSSETSSFSYEVNHFHGGNFGHNGRVQVSGAYQSNLPHRSLTPLSTYTGGSTRGAMAGHGSYNQRTAHRTPTGYPPMGLSGNLEDPRLCGNENILPPRYSRPLSIVGRSYERNLRVRNRYDRLSFSDESARARWVSEGVAMMDQSAYYDSRNLFDQHQDMRLDIDNMSYEELLALEDRIGYVSTGLSEDSMSRCLIETIYCSSYHIPEGCKEDNCAICLESYKNGEYVGRLKCRHDFHASCIKKWLLIKNICPICKASAFEDNSKGQ